MTVGFLRTHPAHVEGVVCPLFIASSSTAAAFSSIWRAKHHTEQTGGNRAMCCWPLSFPAMQGGCSNWASERAGGDAHLWSVVGLLDVNGLEYLFQ
ncbi:UNVERIFIED_CONTAM: hypothetical protein K2H54_033558 [Gekko kuhli]